MKLQDRVAVVTGGGSGIGRAIALRFAGEGARVVVNDVVLEAAQQTVAAMGPAGERAGALQADVSDSAQVTALFAEVERRFGGLDILVNNAGVGEADDAERRQEFLRKGEARIGEMMSGQPIHTHWDLTQTLTDAQWHRMIGVHLNGTFFCTRQALKLMGPKNRGAIINMSSVAALHGLESATHYSAAKGGILSFTRALAQEVASRSIRVNAICPGLVRTPMTEVFSSSPFISAALTARVPMGRWAEPGEVASVALFLASDESSYFTGQWLSPNGGLFIA